MTRGDSGGGGGGGGGSGASDHSAFLGQSNEMTHSVKLIDKNWHWEDKAMDVRDKSMYRIDTCRYNNYGRHVCAMDPSLLLYSKVEEVHDTLSH